MIPRFQWQDAKSIQDAVAHLGPNVLVKAGGIDLIDRLKENVDSPTKLVNIRTIPGLDQIREDASGIHIGGPFLYIFPAPSPFQTSPPAPSLLALSEHG